MSGSTCTLLIDPLTRVRAKLANGEILVAGDQWPLVVYENLVFDPDNPWVGLLRNKLLVSVSILTV